MSALAIGIGVFVAVLVVRSVIVLRALDRRVRARVELAEDADRESWIDALHAAQTTGRNRIAV